MNRITPYRLLLVALSVLLLAACDGSATSIPLEAPEATPATAGQLPGAVVTQNETTSDLAQSNLPVAAALEPLRLPALSALTLDGRPLRVVATTSIIGDVVGRVGGESIELTTLMGPGQDPHSYQPAAADLTAVANADVIFVNGWDLEEGLVADLATIGETAVIVPISVGISPLPFSDGDTADPHTWLAVDNVSRWAGTTAEVLSALDPAGAGQYLGNGLTYQSELAALDAALRVKLGTIPDDRRVLVTNHDAFGYFASAYDFEVLGTIVPGASTLSEPTASDLAALITTMQERGVCALFTESTVSDRLGQTVAAELDACDTVQVLELFSGSLGPAGSGAESYPSMMQANVDTIISGLR